jgi:hypothetical protein
MFEYAVVIRRQPAKRPSTWQLWLASGMEFEGPLFLPVMNHAGALGFEAVSAGHFDELAVPEILLQRRLGAAPVEIEVAPVGAKAAAANASVRASKPVAKPAPKTDAPKPAPKKSAAKKS